MIEDSDRFVDELKDKVHDLYEEIKILKENEKDYEEYIKGYDKECEKLVKEIKRLKEELKQAKEIAPNEHKYASEMEDEYIEANNIINELEKDFERKIQSCTIGAETTTNDFYCRLHIATLKRWLNKIKELKGSDKE